MARVPGAEAVYEVADLFHQRCLVEDKSLLWPDHNAWTLENLDSFWAAFVGHPDEGTDSFVTKLAGQLEAQSDDVHRIAVDLVAVYGLFPSSGSGGMGMESKLNLIEETRQLRLKDFTADGNTWNRLLEAFRHPIGAPGMFYLAGRPFQMAFYLGFAKRLKEEGVDPFNASQCKELADEVKQQVKQETGAQSGLSRNILLHLLFPDELERIASDDSKNCIFDRFAQEASVASGTNVDDGLLIIRKHLVDKLGRPSVDFYDEDIESLWKNGGPPPPPADPLTKLIAATFLSQAFLQEVNDLLKDKKQLILEGPPGSGKTYVAEKFARWFTGQPLSADVPLNEQVEIVQFHQSYGYEDFVQGIRPETNDDDQLVYRVRDGIFLTLCERATANPEKPFVLIIDEINRGNISRIFGELLLLLEYRGMSVRLPYGSGENATLAIPENLYIIGTMNTADRSLAQIDYALRRRFYFVRFMPVENGRADVFGNWLADQEMEHVDRSRLLHLFVTLNEGIREHLSTDDLQIGHSYFMTDGIETHVVLSRVWTRAVEPLLNEYLHHHRNRDEILDALTPTSLARTTVDVAPEDGMTGMIKPTTATRTRCDAQPRGDQGIPGFYVGVQRG